MINEKVKMKNEDGSAPPDILERCFQFAVEAVKLCQNLDEHPGVGRVLMPQIVRAGTSVVSNVEEAQASQSKADFVSKMAIALKEARETNVRLRILAAASVLAKTKVIPLVQESEELRRILGAIIVSARRSGLDN